MHLHPTRAGRLLLAVAVALLALGWSWPSALARGDEGDEDTYLWTAAYYGGRAARLDVSPGTDLLTDPGWSPTSYWALTQPMGARLVYAVALGVTGLPVSALPLSYYETPEGDVFHGTLTHTPAETRPALRLVAALCGAIGLGLLTLRVGPWLVPGILYLLWRGYIPDALSVAWAEGPLLLGYGIAAATWGTRWFGGAAGLAAAFKLTALGLWPLLLWPRSVGGGRWWLRGPLAALGAWLLLEPPAWLAGGPLYLVTMTLHRSMEFQRSSAGSPGGLMWSPHYSLPFLLAAAVLLALALSAATRRLAAQATTLATIPDCWSAMPPSPRKVTVPARRYSSQAR